jgi:hypothetical protein
LATSENCSFCEQKEPKKLSGMLRIPWAAVVKSLESLFFGAGSFDGAPNARVTLAPHQKTQPQQRARALDCGCLRRSVASSKVFGAAFFKKRQYPPVAKEKSREKNGGIKIEKRDEIFSIDTGPVRVESFSREALGGYPREEHDSTGL